MKKCLILGNGKSPQKSVINFLHKKGYGYLICADGGANSALRLNLIPDIIIGDLDSINEKTLKSFRGKTKIQKISRQNDTDIEKCLKYAIKNNFDEAILLGVTGNRLDHTLCNLGIVLKFYNKIKIQIIAENSILKPLTGMKIIPTKKGETISLYGFSRRTKIKTSGLKYSIDNTPLAFGEKESTSNISISEHIELKIRNGIVFMIRDFNFVKANDLF